MKHKSTLIAILLVIVGLYGCEKKDENDPDITGPSAFFLQNLENAKQRFTIDPTIYNSLQGAQGTLVQISPNSFVDGQGNVVTGAVEVCLIEIYDRKSMLMLGVSTMGVRPSGNLDQMASGGMYYLKGESNGEEVFLVQAIAVKVPVENMGGYDPLMKKYDGFVAEDGTLTWEMADDSVIQLDTIPVEQWWAAYGMLEGEWGWTNCDRWMSYTGSKTPLKVSLPEGYNESNCEVYISYDGEPRSLGRIDRWIDNVFTNVLPYPVGLDCHIIALSEVDGSMYYSIHGITIGWDHVEFIDDFEPVTAAELADLIDALP